MTRSTRILLTIVSSALLAWGDPQADIQELKNQKAALQGEIKKLDQRIAQADSTTRSEAKRFETTQQRQKEDLDRRKQELNELQSKISAMAQELQEEKGKQNRLQLSIESNEAFRKAVSKGLADQCRTLEGLVARSLPWDLENRLDRIRALRRDLENGNASPEEGLIRIRALFTEETRFGDEVAILNKPLVRQNGETVNARILRIGNQWMIYADESETRYGSLERKNLPNGKVDFRWREELSFEERSAIKLAIDVKLARKPPQMVRLPLTLSIEKEAN